jgi:putative salt-induced outer membrane protein YdiY
LLTVSGSALAQAPPADPFIGSVSLGYLATTGNTDSTNGNFALKVSSY